MKKTATKVATAAKPSTTKAKAASPKPVAKRSTAKPALAKVPNKARPAPKSAAKKPAAPAAKAVATKSHKKEKTIRDSFNMPATDYALIATLKTRAIAAGREVKKSELLRAGLRLLSSLESAAFITALAAVHPVKAGRPGAKR